MTYEELFNSLASLSKEDRLDYLNQSNPTYEQGLLKLTKGDQLGADAMGVLGLGLFMLADGKLEDEDFELLQDFLWHLEEDDLFQYLNNADGEAIDAFKEACEACGPEFTDAYVAMGIALCSNNGRLSENELYLADLFLQAGHQN